MISPHRVSVRLPFTHGWQRRRGRHRAIRFQTGWSSANPKIIPILIFKKSLKVLLLDHEREFVQRQSKLGLLQDMDSAVAYDPESVVDMI